MKYLISICLFTGASIGFAACHSEGNSVQEDEVQTIMKGKSNQPDQRDNPYLTAGDKTFIIGTQNGDFPDMGGHAPNEMGGVWSQKIKLLDGFWLRLTDEQGNAAWLQTAERYTTYPEGSMFTYSTSLPGVTVNRFQFCPDGQKGILVSYEFQNQSAEMRRFKVDFVAKTDLFPVWPGKERGMQDGEDRLEWDAEQALYKAQDSVHPWFVVWGADAPAIAHELQADMPHPTQGLGCSGAMTHEISLPAGEKRQITYAIAGSQKDFSAAEQTYQRLQTQKDNLLQQKKDHYADVVHRGQISIPDKALQEVYNWCKINTEWLVQDLDSVGRFLGAGAVEYPWLFGCDNSYALQGVVASGDQALAMQTLRVLKEQSERVNGNGRILHEMSFSGDIWNKGNTQETAHFIMAVWNVFQWTGDESFLTEMYPYMRKGIDYLFREMDQNGNLFPEGYGIMEVRGLNAELIDVSVYAQQALDVMSKAAELLGDGSLAEEYASRSATMLEKINTCFWDENVQSYCDFYGTREQALQTTKGAMEQVSLSGKTDDPVRAAHLKRYEDMYHSFEQYPQGTEKGWSTNINWVISTPMEVGIAPRDRAIKLLDKVRNEHCGAYGPYLSAVERMRMMTIATGVQAMAEAAYGRIDQSLEYVHYIVNTFGYTLPGSINEMMPDYGCPTQAWTIYGIVKPLISYVYGIRPEAYKHKVTFRPQLPTGWDEIAIHRLPIGQQKIDYRVKRTQQGLEIQLTTSEPDWHYQVEETNLPIYRFTVNGQQQTVDAARN